MKAPVKAPFERARRADSITMLDLFAGAGGLTHGFYAASSRFVTERAVEFDAAAAASYRHTFGDKVYAGPIQQWLKDETTPQVDVVVGGPPCQGFSLLGKRDINDDRNSLWKEYASTLRRARPKYFVVENVAAFGKSSQLRDFERAARPGGELEEFRFEWYVLNSADFGAPQARKRAILIGHRHDVPRPSFPVPTHVARHNTVRSAFKGIPFEVSGTELPKSTAETSTRPMPGPFKTTELHLGRDYAPLSLKRFRAIPLGGNRTNLPEDLMAPCWIGHTSGSGDVMGRLHWDRPAVTIRTEFFKPEKGRYLHPEADRAITHLEAARLQGFPDAHQWVGSKTSIAKQIGNAVPIPLGMAIASQILQHF
ncbi:DNA cytosine methyltransferase [Arthrobacter sp. NPDC055138]